MNNKRVLQKATKELDKAKAPVKKKDIIVDPMGQWKYPGQVTRIPSDTITMEGVDYPVLGVPDNGQPVMMQPGAYYDFPGANYVDEYPQMKKGGGLKTKKYTRSIEGTNYLFAESDLFKKPKKLSKKRIFHPNAKYYAEGGALLTKEVTCKKCGWEWDAADGGDDITTCHKCGGQGLVHAQDGGEIEYNGFKYKKVNGQWINSKSGAPVTDQLLIQKLTYEGKPVGSPVVQSAPKPKPISTVTKQQQLETIKNSPVIADQRKANQLRDEIRNENIYFPKGEPSEDEPEGIEGAINSALGYPMAKAALSAEFATNEGQVDNYRHANAGRYAAEAIKDMTGNIPYLSDAAAIIGANALGLGHEVGTFFTNDDDTKPWTSKLKESGEDMYNNFVGTTVGISDMPSVEKTDKLLNLSYSNQLPDGYVKDPRAPRNVPNNMYFKHGPKDPGRYRSRYEDGGEYVELDLTPEEIQEYAKGGFIVEHLDEYAKGGQSGCPPGYTKVNGRCVNTSQWQNVPEKNKSKSKKVQPFVTSDPDEYAYRKAAYDDSLYLVKEYNSKQPKAEKYLNYTGILHNTRQPAVRTVNGFKPAGTDPNYSGSSYAGWSPAWEKYMKNTQNYDTPFENRPIGHAFQKTYFDRHAISTPFGSRTVTLPGEKQRESIRTAVRFKPPVQPVIFAKPQEKKEFHYPKKETKTDNTKKPVPPGKTWQGDYTESSTLDPKTGKVVTIKEPIYEDRLPIREPERGSLQPFVKINYPPPPPPYHGVEPNIQGNEVPMYATPDSGAEFVPDTERYIDWDGNSIGFNGIRFRKPGHGGDLIKKGRRHYLHYPSIETRHSGDIVPEEEEFGMGGIAKYPNGGEPKPRKVRREVKPFTTSNLKEYAKRKQAYDDSLTLYKASLQEHDLLKKTKGVAAYDPLYDKEAYDAYKRLGYPKGYNVNVKRSDNTNTRSVMYEKPVQPVNKKSKPVPKKPQPVNKKSKKVDPFVTSDPKEYALRKAAYDDSLYLYNKTQDIKNLKYYEKSQEPSYYRWKGDINSLNRFMKKNNMDTGYKYDEAKDFPGKIKPVKTEDFGEGIKYPIYKKPVQPVLFKEEIKEDPIVKPIIPVEQPQPPIQDNYPPPPVGGFPPGPPPPPPFNGVEPFIQGDPIPEYATPDRDAQWVAQKERYIDWNGNNISYKLPRFRKPGHSGPLVKGSRTHYLRYPSIETRNSADIIPEEEEFAMGGEYNLGDEIELTEAEVKRLKSLGYIIEEV